MSTDRRQKWLLEWESCQKKRGLRRSKPRQLVVDAFLDASGHISVDELYGSVREKDAGVGYATVYRTMRLLRDCDLVTERHFGQGAARFEPSGPLKHQHSHFVCSVCGAVVEFPCDHAPRQLAIAAEEHGFHVERCSVQAEGSCARCLRRNEAPERSDG